MVKIREWYDKIWERESQFHVNVKFKHPREMYAKSFFKKGQRLLDLGCGNGEIVKYAINFL